MKNLSGVQENFGYLSTKACYVCALWNHFIKAILMNTKRSVSMINRYKISSSCYQIHILSVLLHLCNIYGSYLMIWDRLFKVNNIVS